jgi:hypothetical protein
MQLPQDLQKFPHLALIVLADRQAAKLFLTGGESIEELDGLSMPAAEGAEHEHSFIAPSHDAESDRAMKFSTALGEHVAATVNKHGIDHLHLIMPSEVEHALAATLPADVSTKVASRLHLDLMNEQPLDVVRRLVG